MRNKHYWKHRCFLSFLRYFKNTSGGCIFKISNLTMKILVSSEATRKWGDEDGGSGSLRAEMLDIFSQKKWAGDPAHSGPKNQIKNWHEKSL